MTKRRSALIAAALALTLAWPALAGKVSINYARGFPFGATRTFAYHDTPDTNAPDGLMDARIYGALTAQLSRGGLEQVDENPNIYVTYHLAPEDGTVFDTSTLGYDGYGAGWGSWDGGAAATGSIGGSTTYPAGTLIIDAYDAEEKRLVWRGTGSLVLSDTPEKINKQIRNVMGKMGKKWHKILAGGGR